MCQTVQYVPGNTRHDEDIKCNSSLSWTGEVWILLLNWDFIAQLLIYSTHIWLIFVLLLLDRFENNSNLCLNQLEVSSCWLHRHWTFTCNEDVPVAYHFETFRLTETISWNRFVCFCASAARPQLELSLPRGLSSCMDLQQEKAAH